MPDIFGNWACSQSSRSPKYVLGVFLARGDAFLRRFTTRQFLHRIELGNSLDGLLGNGRPLRLLHVDAAWDVAMRARLWDEDATIVVSTAVIRAFPFGIWRMGDKVGARMAFKDAYPAMLVRYGDRV